MRLTSGLTAVLASIGLVAAFTIGAGVATADPNESGQRPGALQFSVDGQTWSDGPEVVPEWEGSLSPGSDVSREYFVRNNDSEPGTFVVGVGDEFRVSAFGLFTVRSDLDGAAGNTFAYYGVDQTDRTHGPAVVAGTVLATAVLQPGQQIELADYVGIPWEAGNETQGASVNPGIVWSLLVSEPPAGGSSGSSGSSSSSGSSWGSAGISIF